MTTRPYHLADDFIDVEAERAFLAALAVQPRLYWECTDLLHGEVFAAEQDVWRFLSEAVVSEGVPDVPAEWPPAADPSGTARHLADLHRRRLLADLQERMAEALHSDRPSSALFEMLEEEVSRARASVRALEGGRLFWGVRLVDDYLSEVEARRKQRETLGSAICGVPTGLSRLDELLNGLGTGLYILAGAPGVGKTTLTLQMAVHAARKGVPVVYVSYENSPSNLVGKALCATAGVPASEVERGMGHLAALRAAGSELEPALGRLGLVEGTCRLTVSEVQARALQVMNRHGSERCLVVFDYLQRAAHGQGFEAIRHNVSALAGELRDLANRLGSPVLALSSQSRSGGNYGSGGGSASLDSLKESGDLEYSADVVMFLKASSERKAVPPARAVDLVLGKNRFGDVGTVPLVFRADVGVLREEKR